MKKTTILLGTIITLVLLLISGCVNIPGEPSNQNKFAHPQHLAGNPNEPNVEFQIRYFAMVNHSQIAIDANNENGEYMNVLVDLLGNKMEREDAVNTIKSALIVSGGNQLVFGNELIRTFHEHN